jgi:hypothetical protein
MRESALPRPSFAMPVFELDDPREWPSALDAPFDDAARAIDAETQADANAHDARVREWLRAVVASGEGERLARTLADAPSPALARHLRRLLAEIEREASSSTDALGTMLFAIPVIVVAAQEAKALPVTLDGIIPDVAALAAILRDARAFGGCETFALSSSLVGVEAIDLAALPALLAQTGTRSAALDLPPAPLRIEGEVERVHLRFVVGALLTPANADPLADSAIARWGMRFAQALAKALAAPNVTLLALPRPAQRLVLAVQSGRAAQREVSAQLFASNAIRRLRASYGEPTAIVSVHRAVDAPGRGELRLSLSSPFAPKAAEGFRCPLYPYETVQEVTAMLDALLRDCRVTDVRVIAGVHDDVDVVTGGRLFFKDHGAMTH